MVKEFFMNMGFSDQLNWDQPMEHNPQSESAFSSIVSSPSNPNPLAPDNVVIRELIGRLGNICNSQEIHSANTSCYSSPLNSPSKLGSSWPNHCGLGNPVSRLAQFPSFNGLSENGKLSRVSSRKSLMSGGSQMNGVEKNDRLMYDGGNVRKRKAPSRSKAKDPPKIAKGNSNEKRSKTAGTEIEQTSGGDEKETNPKPPEDPKQDYIHVRARRGQATDSHSLAERVRREKISERMKFLQELVPGCSKMTGKAVVLDEIINYVQSLQRQVEFLSMKLATVNPQMDLNLENLVQKDLSGLLPQLVFPTEGSAPTFPSSQQLSNPQISVSNRMQSDCALIPLDDAMRRSLNMQMQLPAVDHLADVANMNGMFWEEDLQRIVHPGFVQNLNNQLLHNPSKEHCPQQSPKGNSDGF